MVFHLEVVEHHSTTNPNPFKLLHYNSPQTKRRQNTIAMVNHDLSGIFYLIHVVIIRRKAVLNTIDNVKGDKKSKLLSQR